LTRQVAVVQYPSLTRSTVRHVELVSLAPARLLLVLIADTGRVEQRQIELPSAASESLLSRLRHRLAEQVAGTRLSDVAPAVEDLADEFAADERAVVATVVATLLETVV